MVRTGNISLGVRVLKEEIAEEIKLLESFLCPEDALGEIGEEWRERNKPIKCQILKCQKMITTLNKFKKQSDEFDKRTW